MNRLLSRAVRVPVTESSQVSEARWVVTSVANSAGFTQTQVSNIAIVTTEAATNLVKHAGGGEILVQLADRPGKAFLEIFALDKGPGMSNVSACFADGYSTAGSPGNGLGAIERLSDSLDFYSSPGHGSAFLARFALQREKQPVQLTVEGLSIPMPGEEVCGDDWGVRHHTSGCTIFVVDGLGHGISASDAAQAAMDAFHRGETLPPAALLQSVDANLRSTRGASAAAVRIDVDARELTFCGIGNIACAALDGLSSRHAVSLSGILGHQVRSFREFTYPWTPDTTVVMNSDGVATRWDLGEYPGLMARSPGLIAAVLYRDFGRSRDDVTAVVARQENR